MNRNRVESLFPVQQQNEEVFANVPSCFYAQLSPEQFRAMQQVYQVAYERALAAQRGSGDNASADMGWGI